MSDGLAIICPEVGEPTKKMDGKILLFSLWILF